MSKKYISISNDRLSHMLSVARKCYEIAKKEGFEEDFCRKMWLIGWLHDIGYEFTTEKEKHPDISVELIQNLYVNINDVDINAIKYHGRNPKKITDEWRILNTADMLIDSKGNDVGVMARLEDIECRFGRYSDTYLTACDVAYLCGLTAINIARMEE